MNRHALQTNPESNMQGAASSRDTRLTLYDESFYDYVTVSARRSAERIVPRVQHCLSVRSVLDVGCGYGAWLDVWQQNGVTDVLGLDGDYVDRDRICISRERFHAADLTRPFNLGRRFDLVQCLEVIEHIPHEYADTLLNCIVDHGDVVLFSAAAPGQGGVNHVNEQSYDHWRERFHGYGYTAIDCIRPAIMRDKLIDPWYRHNILMFASRAGMNVLHDRTRAFEVPRSESVRDVAPAIYKFRRAVIRSIPTPIVSFLAKIKSRSLGALRR